MVSSSVLERPSPASAFIGPADKPVKIEYRMTHYGSAGFRLRSHRSICQMVTDLGYNETSSSEYDPYDKIIWVKLNGKKPEQIEASLRKEIDTYLSHKAQLKREGREDPSGETMKIIQGMRGKHALTP